MELYNFSDLCVCVCLPRYTKTRWSVINRALRREREGDKIMNRCWWSLGNGVNVCNDDCRRRGGVGKRIGLRQLRTEVYMVRIIIATVHN